MPGDEIRGGEGGTGEGGAGEGGADIDVEGGVDEDDGNSDGGRFVGG